MKKQLAIGLGLLFMGVVRSQEPVKYLHVEVGGGISNLSYKLQDGTKQLKTGYTFNAGYSYFFNPTWGVTAGLGIQTFNGLAKLNTVLPYSYVDSDKDSLQFRVNFKNWTETQHVLLLEVPIAAQYKYALNNKIGLLGSMGAKISLPLNKTYKTTGGEITTTGYYKQYGQLELHDLPGRYETSSTVRNGSLSLKPCVSLIADFGGLYNLSPAYDLYLGTYFNCGVTNMLKADTKMVYTPDGAYNGVLASAQTSKVLPVSFGLKLGVYFKMGVKPKKPASSGEEKIQEVVKPVETIVPAQTEVKEEAKPVVVEETKPVAKTEVKEETKPVVVEEVKPVVKTEVKEEKPVIEQKNVVEEKPVVKEDKATQILPTDPANESEKVDHTVMDAGKKRLVPTEDEDVITEAQRRAASLQYRFGFDFGQPIDIEKARLAELAEIMKTHPKLMLRVIGHTCNLGTYESNLKIGLKRANVIKQAFIDLGVNPKQLITESHSFDEPLVPNDSKLNRRKNRRVAFEILNRPKK